MMLMVICGSRRVKAYKIRQRTEAHNSDDTRAREKERERGRGGSVQRGISDWRSAVGSRIRLGLGISAHTVRS